MDVFGLWGVLLMVLWEVGRRGAHNPWRRLHLRPQRRGTVRHVWGDKGLKGLLGKQAPVLLEWRRSSWVQRVVRHLLMIKLMRWRHSGWLDRDEQNQKHSSSKPEPVFTM